MRPDVRGDFTPKLFSVLRSGYRAAEFRADVVAGLTVAIVALPLAMALGVASGASPDKGLVTAVVAGFLISLLGGSRVQVGGPTGAFVVVVFNIIAQHGYEGLVLATLMAGVILTVAGYAKLGQVIKFIPHPVVTGFTAGIAIIIASSQVKDFFGLQIEDVPADFVPKWIAYFGAFDTLKLSALGIGVLALATIIALKKLAPKMPGYLVAVAVSALVTSVFALQVDTVGSRFPNMPTGIPLPTLPVVSFAKIQAVLPSAFTIAFLAGIEALLSAVVGDGLTGFRHRSNQELVGQGLANIGSAFFGGLPATGAVARTATNIRAGARTPVAGLMHALFVLAFALFGSDLMSLVPMAALAAVLFVVAWGMSEYGRFADLLKMPSDDRLILLLTFGLTILVDLSLAIGVGVGLAALMFMSRMTNAMEIGSPRSIDGNDSLDGEDQRANLPVGVEVFRIIGPIFFGVARELLDTLRRIGQSPKVFIVRWRLVPYLDTTGANALRDFVEECRAKKIRVIFSGVQTQPMTLLEKMRLGPGGGLVEHVPGYDAAIALSNDLLKSESKGAGMIEFKTHAMLTTPPKEERR